MERKKTVVTTLVAIGLLFFLAACAVVIPPVSTGTLKVVLKLSEVKIVIQENYRFTITVKKDGIVVDQKAGVKVGGLNQPVEVEFNLLPGHYTVEVVAEVLKDQWRFLSFLSAPDILVESWKTTTISFTVNPYVVTP